MLIPCSIFEKNFSEKQSAILEIQISRLRSSAFGQFQFKRKSCEEQFNFNASLETKFSEIDSNLSNLSAESVVKAKDRAPEGKNLIQQRQKLLKLADSSDESRQNQGRGLVDNKLVKAPQYFYCWPSQGCSSVLVLW